MTYYYKSSAMLALACSGTFPIVVLADFLDKSETTVTLRNAYENVDYRSEPNSPSKLEEWGQGLILDYKSGITEGDVGAGVDVLGLWGIRLDSGGKSTKANRTRSPGTMFPLETDGSAVDEFGSLGITGKLRFKNTIVKTGTLLPQLPVIRSNNGRLLPQTYKGTQINSSWDDFKFTGGKIEVVKSRVSTNWDGMKTPGGTALSNEFYFLGGDYKVNKELLLSYYHGNLQNYYKQHFLGLTYTVALPKGSLTLDLRDFISDSDGKNKSKPAYASAGYYKNSATPTRGVVDNNLWSAYAAYKINSHEIGLGYQSLSGQSNFPHLNQSDGSNVYLITDAMLGRFINAGEKTWHTKYTYDFAELGTPGLSASLLYWRGTDIRTSAGKDSEWERQYIINYVVQSGSLKSASISWKSSVFRTNVHPASTNRDADDYRLTISYPISLF